MLEILTPDHPRWSEFIRRLSLKIGDGCSGCLVESIKVMEEMDGIDILHTLEQFGVRGIFRDCEARDPPDDPPKSHLFLDPDEPDRTGE